MNTSVLSAKHFPEMTDFLSRRRSGKAIKLGDPGPTPEQLNTILTLAARVPDHGKLAPWRFIVFKEDGRNRAGEVLRAAYAAEDSSATEAKLQLESERFLRSPVVIAVISSPKESIKVPEWEQILSAGACCYNLCLAANSLGFSTTWITEWYAYNKKVAESMELNDTERFAGFIYIGTGIEPPEERDRPDIAHITQNF